MEPGRVRHREAGRHHLPGRHIQHHPAVAPVLAPALGDVAPADAVTNFGRPPSTAMPFMWQRSSAAIRSMKGGRQSVRKLPRSASVAMQLNRVATKTGRPSSPAWMSWMSMSPVV